MRRRYSSTLLLAVCLAVISAVPGCWNPFAPPEDKKPPPPPPEYDRSTRENLMLFFARAHENREIDEYAECLHTLYTFWFWEDEISVWPNPWIDASEDITVTENMFQAERVTDIRVDFTNLTTEGDSGNWFVDEILIEETPQRVFWAEFLVDLHVIETTPDGEVDRWVHGRADIHLLPDPQYVDEGYWTIWKIKDRTAEHKKSRDEWGKVKREY